MCIEGNNIPYCPKIKSLQFSILYDLDKVCTLDSIKNKIYSDNSVLSDLREQEYEFNVNPKTSILIFDLILLKTFIT